MDQNIRATTDGLLFAQRKKVQSVTDDWIVVLLWGSNNNNNNKVEVKAARKREERMTVEATECVQDIMFDDGRDGFFSHT